MASPLNYLSDPHVLANQANSIQLSNPASTSPVGHINLLNTYIYVCFKSLGNGSKNINSKKMHNFSEKIGVRRGWGELVYSEN